MIALQEARVLLRDLGLSGKCFTADTLLERLEAHLGIDIAAVPSPRLPAGGISGARITASGSHVMFFPASASDRLQLAVICHECAHLLLSHRGRSVGDVIAETDSPLPADELAAEALGAALVYFAERPERLQSLVRGPAISGISRRSERLRLRLRAYYRPSPLADERC